ncbi:MAG: hypothetical protein IPO22_21025 [Anaerolineales bacterium]|nr:hypothetical protein [Anaerolineales bacterium]
MRTGFAIFFALILLSACVPSQATPQPADPQPAATFTAIPTLTAAPPTPTYAVPPLDDAANTVYYFAPDVCNAKWSNSGEEIPCPGIQGQINAGYVDLLTDTELNLPYKANVLLTIPAQAGDFAEIFGTFPARKIELGDFFRTQLYCMPDSQCDVTFSLGYYDSSGKYYEPFPEWPYNYTEHSHLINFPLDTLLNGQTVQLTLVVRDNDNPIGDLAVWVEPRIFRHPGVSTPTP